jgi:hypothetical protein
MLTLADRSKFEALIADYAKAEIAWRQATERRHAALHAIIDYTNNKLSASTRAGIDHGIGIQRAKADARKLHLTKILGTIAEGTRDVRETMSPSKIFELACEGLNDAPEKPEPAPARPTYSGPLEPERLTVNEITREAGGILDRISTATIEGCPTPFPFPDFNTEPTKPGVVAIDTNPPQRRAEDASQAFRDTFEDTHGFKFPNLDTFSDHIGARPHAGKLSSGSDPNRQCDHGFCWCHPEVGESKT